MQLPKGKITPLGIIAGFLTIVEIVAGTVLTKVEGNIQLMLTWFVLIFPILVFIGFFAILWNRPWVFYPPSEYGDKGPRVFVEGMNPKMMQAVENLSDLPVDLPDVPAIEQMTANILKENVEFVASRNPNAAITLAWLPVENALVIAAIKCGSKVVFHSTKTSPTNIIYLEGKGKINKEEFDNLNWLWKIRHRILKGGEHLSHHSAVEYGEVAAKMVNRLNEIKGKEEEDSE